MGVEALGESGVIGGRGIWCGGGGGDGGNNFEIL